MWGLEIVKSLLAGGSKDGQEAFNSAQRYVLPVFFPVVIKLPEIHQKVNWQNAPLCSVESPHGSIENSCYNNLLLYRFKLVANLSDLLEILVKNLIL